MTRKSESDVKKDPHVAGARETGGRPDDGEPDAGSTTGTTRNDAYVGRVAGEDDGGSGESGAEARATHEGHDEPDTDTAGTRRRKEADAGDR